MPAIRGTATYPGLPSVISGRYACTWGANPNRAYVDVHGPIDSIAGIADLTFSDGNGAYTLKAARLVDCNAVFTPDGIFATLVFEDRRWMWRFATIDGHYNKSAIRGHFVTPTPDFNNQQVGNSVINWQTLYDNQIVPQIQEWTRKSVRELAELCFVALGESSYSLGEMPSDQYPETIWTGASPAFELERLCNEFGHRLCYHVGNDMGMCLPLGYGAQLPEAGAGQENNETFGIDPPEAPLLYLVYGGPKRFEMLFNTKAVGLDFDGRVKDYDEVSYTPQDGGKWFTHGPPFHELLCARRMEQYDKLWPQGLPDISITDTPNIVGLAGGQIVDRYNGYDAYNLAHQCIYRMYQITETIPTDPGSYRFSIPPNSRNDPNDQYSREDIILCPYVLESVGNSAGSVWGVSPARTYGKALFGGANKIPTKITDEIKIPFDIDPDRQMIIYHQPVYYESVIKNAGFGAAGQNRNFPRNFFPTNPVLQCVCMVRDKDTHAVKRYLKSFTLEDLSVRKPKPRKNNTDRPGPGRKAIIKDEILYNEWYYFEALQVDPNTDTITWILNQGASDNNKKDAEAQARYWAKADALKYQLTNPQTRTYNGVQPVFNDGAVQMVSIEFNPSGGIKTVASRNTEHEFNIDPYAMRIQTDNVREYQQQRARQILRKFRNALFLDSMTPPGH